MSKAILSPSSMQQKPPQPKPPPPLQHQHQLARAKIVLEIQLMTKMLKSLTYLGTERVWTKTTIVSTCGLQIQKIMETIVPEYVTTIQEINGNFLSID